MFLFIELCHVHDRMKSKFHLSEWAYHFEYRRLIYTDLTIILITFFLKRSYNFITIRGLIKDTDKNFSCYFMESTELWHQI